MCASTAETPKRAHAVLTDLAHIAFGILTVLAVVYVHPVVSVIMFLTFIIYELNEEWHLEDESYEDIREYGIGLGIGTLIMVVVTIVTR